MHSPIYEFDGISSDDLEKALKLYTELEEIFGEPCAEDEFIFAINNELEHREVIHEKE